MIPHGLPNLQLLQFPPQQGHNLLIALHTQLKPNITQQNFQIVDIFCLTFCIFIIHLLLTIRMEICGGSFRFLKQKLRGFGFLGRLYGKLVLFLHLFEFVLTLEVYYF